MRLPSRTAGLVSLAVVLVFAGWPLLAGRGAGPAPEDEAGGDGTGAATEPTGEARLVGRAEREAGGTTPGPADVAVPVARVGGTVVAVTEEGAVPVADVAVEVSFEAFRHRMGWGSYWICHRETVRTGTDGGWGLPVPRSDHHLSAAYVTIEGGDGWLAPPRLKLDDGRVFVAVEIPTRIYDHRKWVSLPAPGGSAWPLDATRRWARPLVRLERADRVAGLALDPWGGRLPNVLVGCAWPVRDAGLLRRITLTDAMGRFAFAVPAAAARVELDLRLRPKWEEVQRLRPPAAPQPTPVPPGRPPAAPPAEEPRPDRHPWPGIPRVSVAPGARGVVLQAREQALLSGWVRTPEGRVLTSGDFDVQPGPGCPWPLGYANDGERRIHASFEPDGRFVVRGLPAGRWVLVYRLEREDAPPLLGHGVAVAPAEAVALVCRPGVKLDVRFDVLPGEAPLDPASWVHADFLQPASEPAAPGWWRDADAPLLTRFREQEDCTRRSGQPSTRSDVWLDPTPGVLYAVAADGRQALLEGVDPAAGPRRVVLRPGGVIEGVVADYERLGFLERSVEDYTPDVWVVARRGHLVRKGRLDREGRFRIDGLPPGAWDVALQGEHVYAGNPRARRAGVPVGTTDVVLRAR